MKKTFDFGPEAKPLDMAILLGDPELIEFYLDNENFQKSITQEERKEAEKYIDFLNKQIN